MDFTYQELHGYSDGFREQIGFGGFGDVFLGRLTEPKGHLPKGTQVAIKASHNLKDSWGQSATEEDWQLTIEEQWRTEIKYLSRLHHPNIIKLYGSAKFNNKYYLVYEYMQNGSVATRLEDLDWSQTKKVYLGSAAALQYLHDQSPALIFGDFSADNILIDEEFNAKLSDFGLLVEEQVKDNRHGTTALFEYDLKQTDICSMGVFLIQLITKQVLLDKSAISFYIGPKMREDLREGKKIIHEKLTNTGCDDGDANLLVELALQCVEDDHSKWPTIHDLIEQLQKLK